MRALALALTFALAAGPAVAAEQTAPRTVTVTGRGEVKKSPDRAIVSYTIVTQGDTTKQVQDLVASNKARVSSSVDHIKSVVGNQGEVTYRPSIEQVTRWDEKTREQVVSGYRVTTRIEAVLEGEEAINDKLGKLFDSSKIETDTVGQPVLGLSEARAAEAHREALKKAMTHAVEQAESQLEDGEKLGAALQRGNSPDVPSPRPFAAGLAAARSMSAESASVGESMVQTGKLTVSVATQVVFEVLGDALRLGLNATFK